MSREKESGRQNEQREKKVAVTLWHRKHTHTHTYTLHNFSTRPDVHHFMSLHLPVLNLIFLPSHTHHCLLAVFRHRILRMLTINPPFKKLDLLPSPLNTEALVEQLWKMMKSVLQLG